MFLQRPKPVKFICGFIYSYEDVYLKVKKIMRKKFGRIDYESQIIDFDFTDYYYKEMGKPLFRRFVSFEELKSPSDFVKIKLWCIKIEKKISQQGKRKINIDPGYINESKLVLATTKDYYHRIYLEKGVYAEVTLYYKDKNFCDLPTTYPDYRTHLYKNIFLSVREAYRKQLLNE
ncbi:MAG TPA: DUF4416 family protein [Candidatus Omnitrophica bacterium]|nr:DUF4416 family protein [Candidatus Omnitrophota bacterium]